MKVRMTLDVDDRDRYVIAKYFGRDGGSRAKRSQVRQFVRGALETAVREHGAALLGRGQQKTIERLRDGRVKEREPLRAPAEKQLHLFMGEAE